MKMKFKRGEIVRCKSGFSTHHDSGGAGYEPEHVFTITNITNENKEDDNIIYWGGVRNCGVFGRTLEPNTIKNWKEKIYAKRT